MLFLWKECHETATDEYYGNKNRADMESLGWATTLNRSLECARYCDIETSITDLEEDENYQNNCGSESNNLHNFS